MGHPHAVVGPGDEGQTEDEGEIAKRSLLRMVSLLGKVENPFLAENPAEVNAAPRRAGPPFQTARRSGIMGVFLDPTKDHDMNETKWHSLDVTETLAGLATDPRRGLSEEEAARRLTEYGPNELKKEDRVSTWTLFLGQFKNILIIILLIATVLSAAVGEIFDAGLILVIVVFCALLGFLQEYRAGKALEALKKMLSPTVRLIRDGKEQDVPSKDVVPGDILLLEAGFKIPADGRLIENASLKCDEASLTGESMPVAKDIGRLTASVRVADRTNMVFTGTVVTYGRGKAVVTSTGPLTEFGKIAEEVAAVEVEKTPLEKRTDEIGKWLGIISLGICLLITVFSIVRQALVGTVDLPFVDQDGHVRRFPRRGRRPRGPGGHRHRRPGHRHAPDGQGQRPDPEDARGRDLGLHDGHLLGQDRDADQGRDDRPEDPRRRPAGRGHGRRLRSGRSVQGFRGRRRRLPGRPGAPAQGGRLLQRFVARGEGRTLVGQGRPDGRGPRRRRGQVRAQSDASSGWRIPASRRSHSARRGSG